MLCQIHLLDWIVFWKQTMTVLFPPFQLGCFLFPYLFWLLWLKLPILCWIEVVKVNNLVLFLILVGKILVFAHWVWCWLWVSHIWPILCWGMVPLFPLCWVFYHKWVLYLIKCFFRIYWYDHVIFVFAFVYVMYYVDWFVNIIPSLHPWDESHLVMV